MENIPHGLKEAIENDELVLFIGAGLSWDLKNTEGKTLGGWKEMVSSILAFLKDKECITAKEQQSCEELGPIDALKELKKKGIDKNIVGDFIKRYFTLGEENNLSLQEDLFKLSTKIITTNYDRAFEIAADELNNNKAYKTRNYEISRLKKAPVFLFKLHGCIEHIDSMVLFPSDYEDLYKSKSQDAKHVLQALRNLIFNKTFLFIGTGLGDHQINSIFKEIKRTQGNYDQGHFIITPNPLNKSLNFLTRIEINDYAEIPSVIKQLLLIKENAETKKSTEEKQRLKQIKELDEKNISLTEQLGQVQNEFKRKSLLLKREANNRFSTGLKHHQAEEYLEASEEYKAATELNPKYSDAYYNWGNALYDLAKTKSGSEAEELYKEACKKYDKAITYKQDYHEAYYNWGVALMKLAKTKSGNEAEELYNEAIKKYKEAIKIKKDYQEAYNNWGFALMELAKTKSGSEAEELYNEAIKKYKEAIKINKDYYEAYNNWGVTLILLTMTRPCDKAEKRYNEAIKKCKEATQIKQNFPEAYCLWGNALTLLAQTKSCEKAEKLYKEAFKKYDKATQIKQNSPEAYCIWGNALIELARTKSASEAEKLYKEAFEKYNLATTYKQDDHEAYYNWGIAFIELASIKSGSETKILQNKAFEKFQQAVECGGDTYNLAYLYAIRNQKVEALKYLDIALSRNEVTVNFVEERWEELRNDPDFQDLLSRYKK